MVTKTWSSISVFNGDRQNRLCYGAFNCSSVSFTFVQIQYHKEEPNLEDLKIASRHHKYTLYFENPYLVSITWLTTTVVRKQIPVFRLIWKV